MPCAHPVVDFAGGRPRSAAVSKHFHFAVVSDAVWVKFSPSDYDQIISESSPPLQFNSHKHLILLLCRSHILIDQNSKSFTLDIRSQKKCYMLGSRSLTIAWGDSPDYWGWISVPESRFPENAKLNSVYWLHIKGEIPICRLSQNTIYGAYFLFKLPDLDFTGFEDVPVQVSVSVANEDGLPITDHHLIFSWQQTLYISSHRRTWILRKSLKTLFRFQLRETMGGWR